jgi:hypothetical protein
VLEINYCAFEIDHFAVNGSHDGSFLGDICITEFGIEIRYETPKGRAVKAQKGLALDVSLVA